MSSFGVSVGESRVDDINGLVYAERDWPETPDRAGIEAWNDWVTDVQTYAAADGACREEAYEAGMEALAPQLEQFEADHADEIQNVADTWQSMIDEASTYPEWDDAAAAGTAMYPGWDGMAPSGT